MKFSKTTTLIVLGIIALAVLVYLFTFSTGKNKMATDIPRAAHLEVADERVGVGAEAIPGKLVTVNYIGTFADGRKFDSSYDRGEPFQFLLGAGQVIQGWDDGVAGMKVGGKRKLVVPPWFGYGNRDVGNGLIPPGSTLVFEIELLKVSNP